MQKQKKYTQQERIKIIELKAKGHPYSKIGEEAGFPVSKHSAHRIVKVWEDEQRLEDAPRPGRPEKYPDTDLAQVLKDASQADPEATLEDITNDPVLNLAPAIDISAKTAGRRLRSQDYYSFTMRVEENLGEKDKRQRVQWCKERRRWKETWRKKVAEPRLEIGYFSIDISKYSRTRQKSTAAVLMEAKCAFVEREGLAMIQNMSKPVTILGAFLPNSLLRLHMATTPP